MKPHDDLFREMVSDPAAQRDMVQICLPDLAARIAMDTVTPVEATFTGGKQADLLVSMRDHRGREHLVYMLVEHKSYHDPLVAVLVATPLRARRCTHMHPVQLYRYLGEIWQQQWIHRESKVRGPLPVIHPVVLYHGAAPWTAPLELTGLHRADDHAAGLGAKTSPYITDLVYRLVDLRTIQPERLRIATRTLAFLITLRYVFHRLEQPTARRLVAMLGTLPIGAKTRFRLFEYLLFNMPDENTGLLVTELKAREYTMEGGAAIMTVAQELRRQGREEGLDEGRKEATHDVARQMLEKGAAPDFVIETTGLTAEQVAALQNGKKK